MGYLKQAIVGTGWMGSLRVLTRGFGFIKTIVLARILTPADFGLFGIAQLALALLETFTEPGVSLALIQQDEEVDDYINTAWIISIVRGIIISLLIIVLSPWIASFFKAPDALNILKITALIPLIRGFINPSAVTFVKKLEFKKEFILRSIPMIVDIATSIFFSLQLLSPIAIIYGMIAGSATEVILTFYMLDLCPKFIFVKDQAKKFLNFGKWVTVGWIMSYLGEQFDDIIVGRILGTANLGIYQMAFKLSVLPSSELGEVIAKVAFPVYSKIAADKERAKKALVKTTAFLIVFAFPIMTLIILFPELIIRLTLGEQWVEASNTLKILALYGFIRVQGQAASAMLYAFGRPDVAAFLRTLRFILLALLIFPFITLLGLRGAAWAVVISAVPVQPLMWWKIKTFLDEKQSASKH